MKTQSTFTNWDFNTVWVIASGVNSGYPYIDTNLPTVTNVTSTTADGLYGIGQVINIAVTFSKAVTSTGDVTVTLETGTTDRTCTFTVSAATSGTCNYTVEAGDATDDLTVNSVTGTIKDSVAHTLTNTTPVTNLAANKTLIIETTSPTVTLASNDVTQGGGTSTRALSFTTSLSESSSGFTVDDITAVNATVDGFTETTTAQQYSFTVHPTATGAVTLDIAAGAAQDAAGNPSAAATQYSFTYTNILLVESVSVDKGTITIVYDDGTTKEFTPFQDNYIHHYVISYDDRHVVVVGDGVMKIYTTGVLTTTHRFSEQALAKSDTTFETKHLYNAYDTVVLATSSKIIVWRLMSSGNLKKKVTATFNDAGTTPTISFNKKKKRIKLNFEKNQALIWKLLRTGKLKTLQP